MNSSFLVADGMNAGGVVYKITCAVNGKVYIGLTKGAVYDRWHQHRKAAKTGCSSALYQAMRKHGESQFSIEVIASALNGQTLADLERLLIKQYDSYGRGGYNMSFGGERDMCRTMTQEGRERLKMARNRPDDLAANKARNKVRMESAEGKMHQSMMVEAARRSSFKLSNSRKVYAATPEGAFQIKAAAKKGAAQKALISSKAVTVNGAKFSSVQDAAIAFGIERAAVRYRIKSPNFSVWAWE
jgi:group I intron endonuclease